MMTRPTSNHQDSKPKFLVILGAGSSIPCGMPSVSEIDELMNHWSQEWTPEPSEDVFNILLQVSEQYFGTNHYGIRPNYERVLGEMTALASWLSPGPFGNPTIEAINDGASFGRFKWLREFPEKYAGKKFVLDQQTFLLRKLASHMRDLSKKFNSKKLDSQDPVFSKFSNYRKFFDKLRDHFELGIYNLNYDTVAGTAWPEAYCGFDRQGQGNFEPLSVSQRKEWGFVYHLHGSVHHCIVEHPRRIRWQNDLSSEFKDGPNFAREMAQGFKPVPLTTFITGGFKLDQLLVDPYQTLYSVLVRHVHEADAILVVGYGFGDPHVNCVLRNRFEGPDHDDRPHPKVVVLEKSCPKRYRTARLQSHEFWSWEMTHTFGTRFSSSPMPPSNDDRTVKELIEKESFEKDGGNRVAVWHGGFPEVLSAVNKVTDLLNGGCWQEVHIGASGVE